MKITLINGVTLNAIIVTGAKKTLQGTIRDALTFVFPGSESMEGLDALFTAGNCDSITIEEDGGAVYIHKGYTVRVELTKSAVKVTEETAETEAVYEDRITVTMAQRTYAESQMAAMEATMNALLKGEE